MSEEKVRKVRPMFLMIPREDAGFDVHKCVGFEEVRRVMDGAGIDASDRRLEGVVLVRGDEVPVKVKTQASIRFGNR